MSENIPSWKSLITILEGAYSPHTIRGYHTDLKTFDEWCQKHNRKMVPASDETLVDFIEEQATTICPNSIRRRLVAVARLHALSGYGDPTKSEWIRLAIRRAKRDRPTRPKQALGLTAKLRDRLIAACPDTMIGLRNQALIAIGYDTLCRRSEIVALRIEDLKIRPAGGANILVRRSKNDPFGRGRQAYLSEQGLSIVGNWFTAAGIEEGALLRIVYQQQVGQRPIRPDQVGRILKEVAKEAGLDRKTIKGLSGHSMRVGAAQDLMVQGRNIIQIMRAGGWKSVNVVSRYCEEADFNIWESSGDTVLRQSVDRAQDK